MKLVHRPWTSREPRVLVSGLSDADDARAVLRLRARVVEKLYPGAVCALSPDGLSMEINDDSALMIGSYQGITSVEEDEDG